MLQTITKYHEPNTAIESCLLDFWLRPNFVNIDKFELDIFPFEDRNNEHSEIKFIIAHLKSH